MNLERYGTKVKLRPTSQSVDGYVVLRINYKVMSLSDPNERLRCQTELIKQVIIMKNKQANKKQKQNKTKNITKRLNPSEVTILPLVEFPKGVKLDPLLFATTIQKFSKNSYLSLAVLLLSDYSARALRTMKLLFLSRNNWEKHKGYCIMRSKLVVLFCW